jgi:hypothetical protein
MPPDRFSKAITISSPPSTGVGALSCTKPQSKAGSTSPGISPLPAVASHQKPRLLAICKHAEQQQRTPQPQLEHQQPAQQRAADGQPQADHLVDHADLGRAVGHALEQEGRHQRAGEGVAQLVQHDEDEEGRRPGLAEVAAQAAEQRLEARAPRRPGRQRQREADAQQQRQQVDPSAASASDPAPSHRAAGRAAHAPAAARSGRSARSPAPPPPAPQRSR